MLDEDSDILFDESMDFGVDMDIFSNDETDDDDTQDDKEDDDLDFDAVFSYFNEADAERIINALINGKSVPADLQPLYQKAIQRNK